MDKERLIKGLFDDKYEDNPDTKFISERYEFWKHQTNEEGLIYSYTDAAHKARIDFYDKQTDQ